MSNEGLAMAVPHGTGPTETPKGGKGKLQFPILQCGTDPFSN